MVGSRILILRHTGIQLNKKVETHMHVDGNKPGRSIAISFGDYTGGGIFGFSCIATGDVARKTAPSRAERRWISP